MEWVILAWFFILGAIIGSFLNVVIYRLNTGKSLNGHSHCLSCGTQLSWYELVPLFSYAAQVGACNTCGARIPSRYIVVEFLTAVLFVCIAAVFFNDPVQLFLNLIIGALLTVVLVYDLRHTIIPDQLVVYLTAVACALVMWNPDTYALSLPGISIILGALVPALCIGGLWLVSHGRWIGLGDAKLVIPLGIVLGFPGSLSMLVFAFWIGALVGILLLGFSSLIRVPRMRRMMRGQLRLPFSTAPLTIKSEVPFAPFLILAFFLVHLAHAEVLAVVDHFLPPFI